MTIKQRKYYRVIKLQSWTKLVETNAISARISQFPCKETPTRLQDCFPSSLPSLIVAGRTEVSSGEFWWQSNIDKGERGKICCGKWLSRSKFSFIPK